MKVPKTVVAVLAAFDSRTDSFETHTVQSEIAKAVDPKGLSEEDRQGYWAEVAAFAFDTHPYPAGGPWNTYFQPAMTLTRKDDGTAIYRPDIDDASPETLDYWKLRARTTTHPILRARYADLVWDFSKRVTNQRPEVEFAHLAVDSYASAIQMDRGAAWGDNIYNIERMLSIATMINDHTRSTNAVTTIINYAKQTADDTKRGTYCYLFDLLVKPKKRPPLTDKQLGEIIGDFERRFAEMTDPNGKYNADPHSPKDIGLRLAEFYRREGLEDDRKIVLGKIAAAFERRANLGDAMGKMIFLDDARDFYLQGGQQAEADRVLREMQTTAPQVRGEMKTVTAKAEVPEEHRQQLLKWLVEGGVESGLWKWAIRYIPSQVDIQKRKTEEAEQFPIATMFPPVIVGDEGIVAEIDDTTGDAEGSVVWDTAQFMNLVFPLFMSWCLDHLIEQGLTKDVFIDYVIQSPVFEKARLELIAKGFQSHLDGGYAEAIHLLIPQIERGIVNLTYFLGGTSKKQHRTGRGVMQSKSLNDALSDPAVDQALGTDLRVYLIAVLSHPKGMNLRNLVGHGLLDSEVFAKAMSERIIHALAALALVRATPLNGETPQPEDAA